MPFRDFDALTMKPIDTEEVERQVDDVYYGSTKLEPRWSKYPRPPRPIYTQWGGLNPLTWHTYQVITQPIKAVLVEYATHTVKLEGRQAFLFLQIVGDERMELFK